MLFFGGTDEPPSAGDLNQILFAFAGAFTATTLPTTMMGATLPMLAKHVVHRDEHLGNRIGALYAINTFGAVLGTLSCAFVFLPRLGLTRTIVVGATVNVLVFFIICFLMRSQRSDSSIRETAAEDAQHERSGQPKFGKTPTAKDADPSDTTPQSWILWLIFLSGAVSFAYEIIFTRMIGHFLGGSVFAFATMLASFLFGIAIGGGIASCLARTSRASALGFYYAQCGTMFLALMSWYLIEHLAGKINELALVNESETIPRVLYTILILLPPAVMIGMTFPWAIRIHARDERDAASSSAKVYTWNTVGGVTGAFLTGTFLLPWTNYQLALTIAIAANLALAACMFVAANPRLIHLSIVVTGVITALFVSPSQPDELLRVSSFQDYHRLGRLDFVKTGRSATVTMHNHAGHYAFSTNGLPEAGAAHQGSLAQWDSAPRWLGVLPGLLRPQAESMLVIGFGGGIAPAHALQSFRSIDVFELEEGMIEANRLVSTNRMYDSISDSRVNIILNDGRSGLALTRKKYDAIVSQPSHPFTAGASHLYTREFFQEVRDHFNDDGVFLLWMDCEFADVAIFRSLSATLAETFPHISLFRPNISTLLFVGSMSSLEIDADFEMPDNESDRSLLMGMGLDSPVNLFAVRSLDNDSLRRVAEGAVPTTDNNNVLALRRLESNPEQEAKRFGQIFDLINQHDPLIHPASAGSLNHSFDPLMIADRRDFMKQKKNAAMIADRIEDESKRWLAMAMLAFSKGDMGLTEVYCRKSVESDDSNGHAWIMLYLRQVVDDQTVRSKLNEREVAIIDATEMMRRKQTEKMPAVDEILASVSSSDPLFAWATLLRIQWRDRFDSSGLIRQRGRENLALIDRLAPYTQPNLILMYRIRAAMLADRPHVALSTAQAISDLARMKISPKKSPSGSDASVSINPQQLRMDLGNTLRAISTLENHPRLSRQRFYGVQFYVNHQLIELAQWMRDNG